MAAMNTSAAHAATLLWTASDSGVLARITAAMQARNAHPARTLLLLPYAQLLGQARQLWAQQRPDGFSPGLRPPVAGAKGWPPFPPAATICALTPAWTA